LITVPKDDIKEKFIKNFQDLNKYGFYDLVHFRDKDVGFSIKKKFKADEKMISLIKVALLDKEGLNRRVYIAASYGELNERQDGLIIRTFEKTNLKDPIDIEARGDYVYNTAENTFYKDGQKKSGAEIVNEFYKTHIKSTKLVSGLGVRLRMWFWRTLVTKTLSNISKFFYYLLLAISGTRYSYDPFFEEEKTDEFGARDKVKTIQTEGKKIELIGYEASRWSILFYAFLHLFLYVLFMSINFKPHLLVKLLENNFLVAIYVVFSLWLIEAVIPELLKMLIKIFSKKSFACSFRKIKV